MSTLVTNLKIFVASPSDIEDERTTLDRVVEELNKMPGNRLSIRFELVKWETDSYPGVGDDAQYVVNDQIGENYDIFIGILWKRFGSPTLKASSGTEEEFNRAYERYRGNPNNIRIMCYFNDSPPASMSEIDTDQYKKVTVFREKIRKLGVYDWTYKEPDDFARALRLHLGKAMEDYGKTWGQRSETKAEVDFAKLESKEGKTPTTQIVAETGEGFLDLIISSVDDMDSATKSYSRIGTLQKELTKNTEECTNEMNRLPQPVNPREARPLVNKQADYWENFAQRIEVELPILSAKFRSGIDSFSKSVQLLEDFETKDKDQVMNAINAVREIKSASINAQASTKNLRAILQKIPRLTVQLNHAKRHLNKVLDDILEEYVTEENLAAEAENIMESVLKKFD
jgi:hypothetical protein